jgi:hypothetical protein
MPVFCELDMGKVPFTKSKVSYRNLSAMNLDALRADLFNSDVCKNTDMFDVNELAIQDVPKNPKTIEITYC